MARELAVIPPLLRQARGNLTGNARDLAPVPLPQVLDDPARIAREAQLRVDLADGLALALHRDVELPVARERRVRGGRRLHVVGLGGTTQTQVLKAVSYLQAQGVAVAGAAP